MAFLCLSLLEGVVCKTRTITCRGNYAETGKRQPRRLVQSLMPIRVILASRSVSCLSACGMYCVYRQRSVVIATIYSLWLLVNNFAVLTIKFDGGRS